MQELQGSSRRHRPYQSGREESKQVADGVVQQIYPGSDGVVRAVEVGTATETLERPIHYLYPLELICDRSKPPERNPLAGAFRPRRQAAAFAVENIKAIALHEQAS